METTKKLVEKLQEVKGKLMSMALYEGNMPEEATDLIFNLDELMDLSCKVMIDQTKKLDAINTKLDKVLAK